MEPLTNHALSNLNIPYLSRVTKMTTKIGEDLKNEAKLVVVLY